MNDGDTPDQENPSAGKEELQLSRLKDLVAASPGDPTRVALLVRNLMKRGDIEGTAVALRRMLAAPADEVAAFRLATSQLKAAMKRASGTDGPEAEHTRETLAIIYGDPNFIALARRFPEELRPFARRARRLGLTGPPWDEVIHTNQPDIRTMREWDFEAMPPRARGFLSAKLAAVPMEVPSREGHLRFLVINQGTFRRATTLHTKEPDSLRWIDRMAPGSVFWDIGANVGVLSLYAAQRGDLDVHAFEPAAVNY